MPQPFDKSSLTARQLHVENEEKTKTVKLYFSIENEIEFSSMFTLYLCAKAKMCKNVDKDV